MALQNYYSPSQPSSQGYQGQQGASQTPSPQVSAQTYRGTSWTPAPGSTGQNLPNQQQNPYSTGGSTQQQPQTSYSNSPVNPNGSINYQQVQRWSGGTSSGPATSGIASSLGGGQNPNLVTGPPLMAAPQPSSPDPFAAMGGGYWTGQQWVPRNHPLAAGAPAPTPGGTAQPNPALYSPYGPYPGRPDGTVFQPGMMPQYQFQDYQTAQFTQQPPQIPGLEGLYAQQDAGLAALQGGSLPPEIVAQLKERQKADALAMQQQLGTQMNQGFASRGMLGAGAHQASMRNLGDQTMENVLGNYRDIDIAAAQQGFQDKLRALDMANSVAGQRGQLGLAQAAFAADQQARQAQENQFAFQSQFAAPGFEREGFMGQQGLNLQGANSGLGAYQTDLDAFFQNRGMDLQRELANRGMDVDLRRLQSQEGMFDRSLSLDWARLMNDMQMGRYGLGFNYAQLQNQAQNQMFNQLFGGGMV